MSTHFRFVRFSLLVAVLLSLHGERVDGQLWRNSLDLTFDDGNGNSMPYRLFVPPGHDNPGAEYPLVLFLHRGAFRGDDNVLQVSEHINGLIRATQGEQFPAFLLAPHAPEPWWYDSTRDLPMQIVQSVEQQYQIDTNRIYVTGTSMGGFGTPDIVSRNPDRFAAAVPMSAGLFPDPEEYDFGELLPESFPVIDLEAMADVPFWVFHGENDDIIPAQWSLDLVEALQGVDGDVRYTEIPGDISHWGIWSSIYFDREDLLYPWLFAQSRSDFEIVGDFNRNQILDTSDVNLLAEVIQTAAGEDRFDLNNDGSFSRNDHLHWIEQIANTYLGDANLDGEFNSTDLVEVFQAAEYEDGIRGNSTWESGDWNADGEFNSADLVTAFQQGGYEIGPRNEAPGVPEPSSSILFLGMCLAAVHFIRRRSTVQ